ncbi:RagB/SusD family nutrient uptake outer membrane protein [Desertivirga xinjiangensis]|uniref:RagB/SusD family nutrient uptake outer membrane protein n=1 Tax=Desertivirga xinjiangensis TaxID=539206 RepID=UPI002108B1AB|nr:RagB/SusD family nutrient uptake outer membrane protein [Pedobacter xinjiangensis]
MKNNIRIFYSVPVFLACFFLSACEKFLESKPKDFLSPENYYNTEEQINFALNGVYDVLGQRGMYGDALISRMGTEADEGFYAVSTFRGPQVYDFSTSDTYVTTLWQLLYDGINRANMLIENIDKPDMTDESRADILGQAKFLRAYYYFLLVSNWGDVPLILKATSSANNSAVPRTPAKEVYAIIIREMEEAEGMVKDAATLGFGGRISKSAVQGILARVCLYAAGNPVNDKSKYNDVIKWTEKIIKSDYHKLNPSFENVFINYASDKYDMRESIWEVEFWGNTAGAYREGGRVGINTGIANPNSALGYSYGFIQTTARLYNSYQAEDKRRDWAIAPFRYVTNGTVKLNWTATQIYQRFAGKWRREYEVVTPKSTNDSPQNFPLLRFSDVLLMYAEAVNEINDGPNAEAYTAINRVRRRGFGFDEMTANSLSDLSGLDYLTFQDQIKAERSRELCFEGLRKNDLIRWGVFKSTMQAVADELAVSPYPYAARAGNNITEPKHLLFPLPAYERGLNPLLSPQNTDW